VADAHPERPALLRFGARCLDEHRLAPWRLNPAASANWDELAARDLPRLTSFSASFSLSMLSDIDTSLLRVWRKRSCPLPSAGQ